MNFNLVRRKLFNWLFRVRSRTLFFLFIGLICIFFFISIILQIRKELTNDQSEFEIPNKWADDSDEVQKYISSFNRTLNSKIDVIDHPVLLWWTPFTGTGGEIRTCGKVKCFFTQDRKFRNHLKTKMLLFYGTHFDPFDLPLPRNGPALEWALLHEESPKNTPILIHSETLALFNHSATFSRKSSFPLTLQYLKDVAMLTEMQYFVPTPEKDKLLSDLAPVAYIHSDCATPLDRDAYITELMKFIPVDSYGKCVQNRKLPEHLSDLTSMDSDEFLRIVARYKFTLTFENAVCEDYITEKLWRPLRIGSVPIYLGSPSVRDWLPNNNSAILASDFKSPKELAEFLKDLNEDRRKYESYLQHKLATSPNEKVTNKRLIVSLNERQWGVDNDFTKGNFVEHFECFLCRHLHEHSVSYRSIVNRDHYHCDSPVSPLTRRPDPTNWWNGQWTSSKCEGKVLSDFIDNGRHINTKEEFFDALKRFMIRGLC